MNKKTFFILLIILFIASFFRLWQLSNIPPGLYPDVAINGTDALETIETGNWRLFYTNNNGREGVFMWLVALAFIIFGVSIWSLKIFAPIFGILTVLGTYFLTKEIFKHHKQYAKYTELTALVAAFFISVSFYHVIFSRIGFRAIMVPFALTFAFYFLLKALNSQKYIFALYSGLFFGLGFYTYISYRFVAVLLPVFLLIWLLPYIKEKENFQKYFKISVFTLLVTFFTALPIGIYFLQNPGDFLGRAGGVSVFESENPLVETAKAIILHLGMFNFYGDVNWRHNFSGDPQLFWPIGIFFLIGIILLIKNTVTAKLEKNRKEFAVLMLLIIWFLTMMMPGFLSSEGNPHALRVIGIIPIIYIISALGFIFIYDKTQELVKNKKTIFILNAVFILLFSYIGISEFNRYFIKYANNPNLNWAFAQDYYDIGQYLNSLPEETTKYVIVNELEHPLGGISIPAQSIMFIERTKFNQLRTHYIKAQDLEQIVLGDEETIIIPLYKDRVLDVLKDMFPQSEIKQEKGFIIYQINQ